MDIQKRIELIKQVGEELITEEELKQLLETKKHPVAYDGFDPSGIPHIAQGLIRAINMNKMTKAGCKFKMLVGDWTAWANNKFGGDLDKIQTAGKLLIEIWKKAGLDIKKVEFIRHSDFITDNDYLKKVMQVARHTTVKRMIRCGQIMGRTETDVTQASQIIYPCLQCADIFHLGVDIAQLGIDQRKVNILAREIGPKLGYWKPIIVSHHMLMGLKEPPKGDIDPIEKKVLMKMSKSIPDTAIFMSDSEDEIKRKIAKAYCPEKQTEENPILEYCKFIIFEKFKSLKIERPKKFGGDLNIHNYKKLEKIYREGKLHPKDLKDAVAIHINKLVKPVRTHFEKNKNARELLKKVKSFVITR